MENNSQLQVTLNIALMLIQDGTSTIETAFLDAIERQNKICLDAIVTLERGEHGMTSTNKDYVEVFKSMKTTAYNRVRNKMI